MRVQRIPELLPNLRTSHASAVWLQLAGALWYSIPLPCSKLSIGGRHWAWYMGVHSISWWLFVSFSAFTHSLTYSSCIHLLDHLLCARHCARFWEIRDESAPDLRMLPTKGLRGRFWIPNFDQIIKCHQAERRKWLRLCCMGACVRGGGSGKAPLGPWNLSFQESREKLYRQREQHGPSPRDRRVWDAEWRWSCKQFIVAGVWGPKVLRQGDSGKWRKLRSGKDENRPEKFNFDLEGKGEVAKILHFGKKTLAWSSWSTYKTWISCFL